MAEGQARRARRRHNGEFKQRVLAECDRPGASVAAVAQAHGVNANLVHKWRRQAGRQADRQGRRPSGSGRAVQVQTDAFIPVPLSTGASIPAAATAIEIDLRRGATAVQIRWPQTAAAECGAWLRAWLA
jgi:transposase